MTGALLELPDTVAFGDVVTADVHGYGRAQGGRDLTENEDPEIVPEWLDTVVEQVVRILRLEEGWDSYGAYAVSVAAAESGLGLLLALYQLLPSLPAPDVVPTSNGGLAFEWSAESGSVEIEVDAPHVGSVFFHEYHTGHEDVVEFRTADVPADYLVRLFVDHLA